MSVCVHLCPVHSNFVLCLTLYVAITTNMKRASLDDAWDESRKLGSLRKTLRSFEKQAREVVSGGSVSNIAANGRSTAFSLYGPGGITPSELVDLWRELVDLFDAVKASLGEGATEQSIKDSMMESLRRVTESYPDLSYLRLPAIQAMP